MVVQSSRQTWIETGCWRHREVTKGVSPWRDASPSQDGTLSVSPTFLRAGWAIPLRQTRLASFLPGLADGHGLHRNPSSRRQT